MTDDQLPDEPYSFEGYPPHLEEMQMRNQNQREPGRRRAGGDDRRDPLPVTKKEPALTRGAVIAVVNLLGALGFSWFADLTAEQTGAIATTALVLAPIIQAVWTRYGVVAAAKVIARVSTRHGTVVAGEAAEAPTGSILGVLGHHAAARVDVDPKLARAYSQPAPNDEQGATAGEIALIVIAVVLVLLVLGGVGVFGR